MTFVHRTWRLALALGLILAAGAFAPVLGANGDVSIVGNSFTPTSLTIAAGDTVTWTITEASGELHSVTSGSPGTDQGTVFDSGINLKDQGQSFQFTFDTAGTYRFFCQVHPTLMTGEIVVTEAGASPPAGSEAPAASEAPAGSEVPAGSPGASAAATPPPVSPEAGEPFPPENKVIAGIVLVAALVVLFGANWFWRRLNPA
jgi:plastocyanin